MLGMRRSKSPTDHQILLGNYEINRFQGKQKPDLTHTSVVMQQRQMQMGIWKLNKGFRYPGSNHKSQIGGYKKNEHLSWETLICKGDRSSDQLEMRPTYSIGEEKTLREKFSTRMGVNDRLLGRKRVTKPNCLGNTNNISHFKTYLFLVCC